MTSVVTQAMEIRVIYLRLILVDIEMFLEGAELDNDD